MSDRLPSTLEPWDAWALKGVLPHSVPRLPMVLLLFLLPIYMFWALGRQSSSRESRGPSFPPRPGTIGLLLEVATP